MHAVLNWLWQGCVVALALAAMLGLLDRARANVRYLVCWAAQLFVLALPIAALLEPRTGQPRALPRVPVEAVVSVPDAWWASGAVMVALWMVWATVGGIRVARAMRAIRRARAHSRPFPSQMESGLAHWRQVRDYGRRARLVVSDAVGAAAVLGTGAPVIAVAPSLVAHLEADELDRVLVHEWAHVQRRDDLVNLLQIAVRTIAGWHPAVWWIDRRLQAEREVACDETTVAITGAPKSYAACLVKLAELRAAGAPLAAPAVLAVWGLRARVTRIVSTQHFLAPRRSFGFAAASATALAVVSVVAAQTQLVESRVFAFPFDSTGASVIRLERPGPVVAHLPAATASSIQRPPRRPPALTGARQSPPPSAVPDDQVPAEPRREVEVPVSAAPAAAVESTEPHARIETSPDPPPLPPVAATEQERSPWATAADGGKSIGTKSKDAGLATAGVFSRFARRVAGSF